MFRNLSETPVDPRRAIGRPFPKSNSPARIGFEPLGQARGARTGPRACPYKPQSFHIANYPHERSLLARVPARNSPHLPYVPESGAAVLCARRRKAGLSLRVGSGPAPDGVDTKGREIFHEAE